MAANNNLTQGENYRSEQNTGVAYVMKLLRKRMIKNISSAENVLSTAISAKHYPLLAARAAINQSQLLGLELGHSVMDNLRKSQVIYDTEELNKMNSFLKLVAEKKGDSNLQDDADLGKLFNDIKTSNDLHNTQNEFVNLEQADPVDNNKFDTIINKYQNALNDRYQLEKYVEKLASPSLNDEQYLDLVKTYIQLTKEIHTIKNTAYNEGYKLQKETINNRFYLRCYTSSLDEKYCPREDFKARLKAIKPEDIKPKVSEIDNTPISSSSQPT